MSVVLTEWYNVVVNSQELCATEYLRHARGVALPDVVITGLDSYLFRNWSYGPNFFFWLYPS